MYAYLKGEISYRSPAFITLEVNGIGFHVNIPLSTYTALQGQEVVSRAPLLVVKRALVLRAQAALPLRLALAALAAWP